MRDVGILKKNFDLNRKENPDPKRLKWIAMWRKGRREVGANEAPTRLAI